MNRTGKMIVTALIMALIMFGAAMWLAPQTNKGSKAVTVEVEHIKGADRTFELRTDAEYLRQLLEENGLASGPETQYGLWIQTVDGETADDSKQQWWGISVNGEFAQYGADSQPVADGDVFTLTLNEGY